MALDRCRVNDVLTALAEEMGVELDDGTLNELTHHVADVLDKPQPADGPHLGHDLRYYMDGITTVQTAMINSDGNLEVTGDPDITRYDGDTWVYCGTCDKRIVGGEDGLSEDWQAV